jgi:hypothetical protein
MTIHAVLKMRVEIEVRPVVISTVSDLVQPLTDRRQNAAFHASAF